METALHRPRAFDIGRITDRLRACLRPRLTLDLRGLAAFRIAAGAILAIDALLRTRDLGLMFAPDGFFPLTTLRQTWNADPSVWSAAFLIDRTWWGGLMLVVQGLAGIWLAAGWQTRPATVVAWAAQLSVMRRTLPATNAGDAWLGALLFWAMFLPLGAVWSVDAIRRRRDRPAPTAETCSIATAAFVFQVLVVYLAAGVAKWNDSWLSGEAVRRALSVHDHGTALGTWIAESGWLTRPLTWGVIAMELALPPLFLVVQRPRLRLGIVCMFIFFHLAILATMSVGLFAAIGITAWLPLLPGAAWKERRPDERRSRGASGDPGRLSPLAATTCGVLLPLAGVGLVHGLSPRHAEPLPPLVAVPLNLCGLVQEWAMFGVVYPTEQWAHAPALLADGRRVDLLRKGAAAVADRPAGGFTSLPHHRWHKLAWLLPWPRFRPLAPHVAAALARDWNARHDASARVESVEIRFVVQNIAAASADRSEQVLASWPERGAEGAGNLDRFLDEAGGDADSR